MKRIRRIAMVFAVAAIAVLSLSAATWVWSTSYDNVTGYRYQIGSESEDGWIYVDKDVTSLTLDRNEETTIYVQLTVDNGRFWSPSGVATYTPQVAPAVDALSSQEQEIVDPEEEVLPVVEEAPVEEVVEEVLPEEAPVEEVPAEEAVVEEIAAEPVEEEAVVEEAEVEPVVEETVEEVTPVEEVVEPVSEEEIVLVEEEVEPVVEEEVLPVVEETEVVVEEEPVVEETVEEVAEEVAPVEEVVLPVVTPVAPEPVVEKKASDFSFGFDMGFGLEIVDDGSYTLNPVLGLNFQNIVKPANWFGLDMELNFVGLFKPETALKDIFGSISSLGKNMAMGGAAELALRPTFIMGTTEFGISVGGGVNIYAVPTLVSGTYIDAIPSLFADENVKLNAYAMAGADLTFNFTDWFNVTFGYQFKYTFDTDVVNGSQMSHTPVFAMGFNF